MKVKETSQAVIKPIEIQRDPCPTLRKISGLFFICLGTVALGVSVAMTLSSSLVVVIAGGAVGGLVGYVLAKYLQNKELTPLQKYQLETLSQVSKHLPEDLRPHIVECM